jgi:hypothetical protein
MPLALFNDPKHWREPDDLFGKVKVNDKKRKWGPSPETKSRSRKFGFRNNELTWSSV